MNAKLISLMCMALIAFGACSGDKVKPTTELLANQWRRDSIFNAIVNNPLYLTELIGKVKTNREAKLVILKDRSLLKEICMSDRMDSLLSGEPQFRENVTNRLVKVMAADSFVCDVTCTSLMKNEGLRKYLIARSLKEMNSKAMPVHK